ncbi:hypothetical protein AUK11_01525 [bacterium CG2_30_37_16]|nr:MAG: hypothetical protein AUK11_01525 [bacterium CG2_30_37_16]
MKNYSEGKLNKIEILGIGVNSLSSANLAQFIKESSNFTIQLTIFKSNSEFLLRATSNKEFRGVLNNATINTPDGMGVLWAAKFLSIPVSENRLIRIVQSVCQMIYSGASLIFNPNYVKTVIPERVGGVDLMINMLKTCAKEKKKVFFLGGSKGVAGKVKEITEAEIEGLNIVGTYDGKAEDVSEIVEAVNNSKAEILFVAFGSPKQEFWIRDNLSKLKTVKVAIGEGGSLEFIVGNYKRAPKWMQKAGLEWLWRLFMNKSKSDTGSRLKRIWRAVPVFIHTVVKYKIKNGQTINENKKAQI